MAVDNVMDIIQHKLYSFVKPRGWQITNRYSSGYCGWKLTEQQTLFSLLPADFCGISLTDSSLMRPVKSVSGIIEIGTNVEFNDYVCGLCKLENCIYKHRNTINI